jgi:hypothetical protein
VPFRRSKDIPTWLFWRIAIDLNRNFLATIAKIDEPESVAAVSDRHAVAFLSSNYRNQR